MSRRRVDAELGIVGAKCERRRSQNDIGRVLSRETAESCESKAEKLELSHLVQARGQGVPMYSKHTTAPPHRGSSTLG